MTTYILRRMLLMAPTLLGVTAVVFFVMALAPGGFGGTVLNDAGAQTEGDEARRIRAYFERRYGLDKPAIVQYGRWLNQVSPLGFTTSRKVTFTDEQLADAEKSLADSQMIKALNAGKKPMDVAVELAQYSDELPQKASIALRVAMADPPGEGLGLLLLIAPELVDAHESEAAWRQSMLSAMAQKTKGASQPDVAAAQWYLDTLGAELAGRDRIHFNRFTFKWPDLGDSLHGRPVLQLLGERVPITVLLNVITLPIIYVIAIITGIFAARHRGKVIDIGSNFVLLALWSVPVMWVGVLLIGYLANKQYFKWFPTGGLHAIEADSMAFLPYFNDDGFQRGWLLDMSWHLILPVICLTYGGFAVLAKLVRGSILENISSDYVRTARAKGLDERTVLFRHVFRNSLLPMITVAAAILPSLFAGSVIVETIFSIPGLGKLSVDAAFMKDRELIMGTTLIGGMIGLFSELIRDLCYAVADPRVSYE